MAYCEDYPCCGHELGCCPDYDESGRQLNMKCTCGATVDINSKSSLCEGCLGGNITPYAEFKAACLKENPDLDEDEIYEWYCDSADLERQGGYDYDYDY